jgi:hypothetical protein
MHTVTSRRIVRSPRSASTSARPRSTSSVLTSGGIAARVGRDHLGCQKDPLLAPMHGSSRQVAARALRPL